jgi:hypothetical protein
MREGSTADVVELYKLPPRHLGPGPHRDDSTEFPCLKKNEVGSINMHATIRRYEAIDRARTSELVKKAEDGLLPRLSALPGFNGYYLIEADQGVMSSVGFFDTAEDAEESNRVASNWVREEKLESALPNPPKITSGVVVAHTTRELVEA